MGAATSTNTAPAIIQAIWRRRGEAGASSVRSPRGTGTAMNSRGRRSVRRGRSALLDASVVATGPLLREVRRRCGPIVSRDGHGTVEQRREYPLRQRAAFAESRERVI